jgi:hypothetical protein
VLQEFFTSVSSLTLYISLNTATMASLADKRKRAGHVVADGPPKRKCGTGECANEERRRVENVGPRVPADSSLDPAHPVRLGGTHGLSGNGIQDIQLAFSE